MNDSERKERKHKALSALSADETSRLILHHVLHWAQGHPEGFDLKSALDDEHFKALRPAAHKALIDNLDKFLPLLQDLAWPSKIEVSTIRSPLATQDDPAPPKNSGPMITFNSFAEIPEVYRENARAIASGQYQIEMPGELLDQFKPKTADEDPKPPTQNGDEGKSPFALTREEARDLERYREVRARAAAVGKCVEIVAG